MKFDTIIIGSGAGGLTAASKASAHSSVLVLESKKAYGGMINPFFRKRFEFDVGLHYLGRAGKKQGFRRFLASLGLEHIEFNEMNPDLIDLYDFGDYQSKLMRGADRWLDYLSKEFPHESKNIRRFKPVLKAVSEVSLLCDGEINPVSIGTTLWRSPLLVKLAKLTLKDVLDDYFSDPYLRATIAGPGGCIAVPPNRASALMALGVVMHFVEGGAYYPVGGSGAIRDGLLHNVRKNGGELKRNQDVVIIEKCGKDGFLVHTAKGETYASKSVISNVDPQLTFRMLSGATPGQKTRERAESQRPSLSTFCTLVGTDRDITKDGISDTNIWYYPTNDIDKLYEPAYKGNMPRDGSLGAFIASKSLKDPNGGRFPEGCHTLEIFTMAAWSVFEPWHKEKPLKRSSEYKELKAKYQEQLLDIAQRYVPSLRKHIKVIESATPATVWSFTGARDGALYGPEASPEQSFLNRSMPVVSGVPGLFLTGAGVASSGVYACMKSGEFASQLNRAYLQKERAMDYAFQTPGVGRLLQAFNLS